jgi:hypothetical protein
VINQKFLPAARNLNIYDLQRLISEKKILQKIMETATVRQCPLVRAKLMKLFAILERLCFCMFRAMRSRNFSDGPFKRARGPI